MVYGMVLAFDEAWPVMLDGQRVSGRWMTWKCQDRRSGLAFWSDSWMESWAEAQHLEQYRWDGKRWW